MIDVLLKDVAGTDLATVEREIDEGPTPKSIDLKGWRVAGRVEIERKKHTVKNILGLLEGEGPHADEAIVIGAALFLARAVTGTRPAPIARDRCARLPRPPAAHRPTGPSGSRRAAGRDGD